MNARLAFTVAKVALLEINVRRDMLERSMDEPMPKFVYICRPAPSAANLLLPMFLAHQAE